MKYPVRSDLALKGHHYPGRLVAIEGIDASGKTTQAGLLVRNLEKKGTRAIYTKEPTDGVIGNLIRKVLSREKELSPIALQYLFCADRAEHQKEIESLLSSGYVVVTDRYFWSAVAYGISDLDGKEDFYLVAFSILSFYHQFLRPDFTFFLDVDVNEAAKRIQKSNKHKEIYDDRAKLEKIDKSYKNLIKRFPEEFMVFDANRPIENVSRDLLEKIVLIENK
jgi:dTMP kinase